ncbi:Uncharacterised protein [BD1-7 clade bacterium]|uniref:Uncharacterized protein n=1 Tax=BD1-7 clade bacterium TaxID=2029982 RepID=A0A5S9QR92_9GAMM|nr:Uncharacterised protein [BD1-7 clade bacterium]CAA0121174.1 Uncharacterised protein [BD1-7 clade bacterium]
MALVIGDLIIRAEVEAPSNASGGAANGATGASASDASYDDKQALIQACVDEVLQVLADRDAP